MKNDTQKQFIAALNYLLNKQGRGAQSQLAKALGIDRSYLNAIVKGRSPGPQEKKDKIAAYFDLHYESMLSLGRWLLSGDSPVEDKEISEWEENWCNKIKSEQSDNGSRKEAMQIREASGIYQFSPRDKKDKNMLLIAEWINQQDDPSEYWTLLKMVLRREEPEFKEWLKQMAADRPPE